MNKEEMGFDSNKKLVVMVMGSLGSTTMTTKIKELIPEFNNKNYQVLIITGNKYYDDYNDVKDIIRQFETMYWEDTDKLIFTNWW